MNRPQRRFKVITESGSIYYVNGIDVWRSRSMVRLGTTYSDIILGQKLRIWVADGKYIDTSPVTYAERWR